MEIASSDNSDWLIDYSIVDDIPIAGNFDWPSQAAPAVNASSAASVTIDCSFGDSDGPKEVEAGSRKRFLELGSMLEPGRPPKTDKATILSDAVQMMEQLRTEAQKLKQSNEDLQEKIKELKAEKNELRDEKQRLKADKEKLEQQVKAMSAPSGFLPHPSSMSAAFAAQSQVAGNKLVPFIGYPGVAMWQFMPPAAVDTSQDHVLRPPVA
ncbi:hypothetical protein CUMW_234860 [Citrus unshiu]|uniref:BHLH domain-containing protein n=1 Tax=Citrus unshiu TaxID=55188 RepID=A0A2H5QJ11_CITUN|nr:hypothetical protein CUMW_234860 [Citrus unshiu]